MKVLATLLLLFLSSCAEHEIPKAPIDPWAVNQPNPPTQYVFLGFEEIPDEVFEGSSLRSKGLLFSNGYAGILTKDLPETKGVLVSGRFVPFSKDGKWPEVFTSVTTPQIVNTDETPVAFVKKCLSQAGVSCLGIFHGPLSAPLLTELTLMFPAEPLKKTTLLVMRLPRTHAEKPLRFRPKHPLIRKVTADQTINVWLKNSDPLNLAKLSSQIRTEPSIAEIYTKQKTSGTFHYIRTFRATPPLDPMTDWPGVNHLKMFEAKITASSPDLILVSKENFGGSFEGPQRIPLLLWSPNLRSPGETSFGELRLVDVAPLLTRVMDLKSPGNFQGNSSAVDPYVLTRPDLTTP